MPKVSVLLTTYNRPKLLKLSLGSVLDQTFQDFEVILLDDNSDDQDQIEYIKSLWNHPKVVVVKSNVQKSERPNTTRYATMINEGLKLAKGEYISYLCDDDVFAPTKLEKMVKMLDENPGINVVYGSQDTVRLTEIPEKFNPDHYPLEVKAHRQSHGMMAEASCMVDHSSVMHRRKIYEELGGWLDAPEHWGEGDAAYWRVINGAGHVFYGIDETLDYRLEHGGNWTKFENLNKMKEDV